MAEGTKKADKTVCRFFATTGCRDGEKCPFSHDSRLVSTSTQLDSVCRFYLVGKCIYGTKCRYDHVRPQNNIAGTSKSSNKKNNVRAPTTTVLKNSKQGQLSSDALSPGGQNNPNWVNAPEFIPKVQKSYADTLKNEDTSPTPRIIKSAEDTLCPYFEVGECPYASCKYVHGEVCDICGKASLMPFDKEQQKRHIDQCEKDFVKDMELSFAVQRSADKTCGICMDVIMEKEVTSERRFGILEKCNHIFCLSCIRRWRQTKREENRIETSVSPGVARTCPECRIPSDFITPSQYWVDNEEEKKKLIDEYKEAMRKKPCRYFDQGRGNCPFAGACFYLHAYPDGRVADLPPPKPRRRRNQNGDIDHVTNLFLWDFLSLRDDGFIQVDFDELLDVTTSDDSDFNFGVDNEW